MEKLNYIWKDRKRHMGLPLSFTRYALSEDRLFISKGFLNLHDDEVILYRIRDISTVRTLWQRIFGMGTITVTSTDKTVPVLLLKNVHNPMYVKEVLHNQVEKFKMQRKVHMSEIMMNDQDADINVPEDEDDLNL